MQRLRSYFGHFLVVTDSLDKISMNVILFYAIYYLVGLAGLKTENILTFRRDFFYFSTFST